MKALVTRLRADKTREKILVEDWPEPDAPTENQVKTVTLFSGVTNGTERNDLLGGNYAHSDSSLPAGWGYQNVGRVIETGPDVKELAIGDVLYMSADHMEFTNIRETGLLIKLPRNVDPTHAALFGMSGVAMRSCRHADLRMGERLLIVGAGFIGQIAAQIASRMGARVTICDIDEKRLSLARQIGAAEEVLNSSQAGALPENRYNAILDVAGVPGMEDQLIKAATMRGRILFIAGRFSLHHDFNLGQCKEITIMQNSHFDKSDLDNVCHLVSHGRISIGPLIKDVVSVKEAARIYDALRDHPETLMGTVFTWENGAQHG